MSGLRSLTVHFQRKIRPKGNKRLTRYKTSKKAPVSLFAPEKAYRRRYAMASQMLCEKMQESENRLGYFCPERYQILDPILTSIYRKK